MSKAKQRGRKLTMIVGLIVAAVALVAVVGYVGVERWYSSNLRPVTSSDGQDVIFVVQPGMNAFEIGSSLEEKGLIRNKTVFSWYVDRTGQRQDLQAGTYRLHSGMSVQNIVDNIANGLVDTSLVTILPGSRLDQIEDTLVNIGFSRRSVEQAVSRMYQHSLLENKPADASLEGYIFPETYQIDGDTEPEDLIKRTFDQFHKKLTPPILKGINKQGLSVHEAIILASIVQEESPNRVEQAKIAQVFLSRLARGMVLGADPTFYYAAAITGQKPSPNLDSRYNTRIYKGLPPGPIGNFNLSALEAVASPAPTDYLYFVAGDDGITRFSRTFEEHERLTKQYCKENCKIQSID